MMSRSHYLTLGVSRTASAEGIRHAFCDLVKRYHPDHLGFPGLFFFQEIVNAYHVLGDSQRRRQYDEGLSHGECRAAMLMPVVIQSESEPGALVPEERTPLRVNSIRGAFEAAFARITERLRGFGRSREERSEGLDVQMILPPEMAVRGGIAFLTIPTCYPCWMCGGARAGGVCAFCDGEGINEEEETVAVQVPPMVGDGTLVEVPLRGLGVYNFYLRLQMRVGAPEA